jgi:hypothetical protein
MSADDECSIIRASCHASVGKVIRHGSNKFESHRVNIVFRSAAVGLYYSRDDAGKLTAAKRLRKSARLWRIGLSAYGYPADNGSFDPPIPPSYDS